jgi:GntR family transcriptional repressor for pyruvate dehydrogenase complex
VSERAAGPGARGLPIVYGLVTWVTRGGLTEVLPRRSAKTSEVVAADVVRDVVARGLVIGNHLPSEAVMLEQYGVGRESLREALRLLETQGLLTIKRGPGGGPIVSGVDPTYLARNAALYFHLSGATYEEVMHAWQVLEPAVAAQVARLPDRAEVRRLMAPHLHQLHPDVERELFVSTTTGFHTTLAQLSGSRVLVLLLRAISHIVVEQVLVSMDPVDERDSIELDHVGIAQAISDGRAAKAQKLMSEHIQHVRDSCARRCPERMQELVEWR